ncbi:MAG: hypothetical protein IPG64_27955 [Haliea sp.]|nr:hypothetical protein [Haliea sp.]
MARSTRGNVRESVYRWGPTEQRSQHRLNNLAALLGHAVDYMNRCTAQNQPATSAGLVLWLYQLAAAEEDTQATGGAENAIQLVTHWGAKGLEWPIVIAMNLTDDLKPRLWGLGVLLPTRSASTTRWPDRTLRYWPAFMGLNTKNVPLLDRINDSAEGRLAMGQEIQETRRLLYVSLTRPRDGLIITLEGKDSGGWMATLAADWMLPGGDTLTLPDGSEIPSACVELQADATEPAVPEYTPNWLTIHHPHRGNGKTAATRGPLRFPAQRDRPHRRSHRAGRATNYRGRIRPRRSARPCTP